MGLLAAMGVFWAGIVSFWLFVVIDGAAVRRAQTRGAIQ
jgi:hypothetical protein